MSKKQKKKENWVELIVDTDISYSHADIAFSFVKNTLARAKYDQFFYTNYVRRSKKFTVVLRFCNLQNQKELAAWIKKDQKIFNLPKTFSKYEREHVLPMIVKASELTVSLDTMLKPSALFYLIHCICMTNFLTNSEQARIYLDLLDDSRGKLFNAYLEKDRDDEED